MRVRVTATLPVFRIRIERTTRRPGYSPPIRPRSESEGESEGWTRDAGDARPVGTTVAAALVATTVSRTSSETVRRIPRLVRGVIASSIPVVRVEGGAGAPPSTSCARAQALLTPERATGTVNVAP